MQSHAASQCYAVLVRISPGYSPLTGRLHTCYSPVRRSPPSYCYSCAAPRLACVKPIASVHPEPGSNSSLYKFCFVLSLQGRLLFLDGSIFTQNLLFLYYLYLTIPKSDLYACHRRKKIGTSRRLLGYSTSLALSRAAVLVESGCKSRGFFITLQLLRQEKSRNFLNIAAMG